MPNNLLAIVSTNKFKYSETFIQSHLAYLGENTVYLFDGYLPTSYSLDKLKTEYPIAPKVNSIFGKKRNDQQQVLAKFIQDQPINIVLAEYGPSGVEMAPICKQLGIPLIVHFHGYDAYRNDVLETSGKNYKSMFKDASAIVAVSKNMVAQLIGLGCPSHKIHLIPYGINTSLFDASSTKKNLEQFVSCGRFVGKKGPSYTIEAFAKVYAQRPSSNLVIIGDGELLDACKALVIKLGLQKVVTFTGALAQSEIAQIFSESAVFLQHSVIDENNDSEGTPLVIMEAGAAGLPVVSTIHGGIPDVIENEKDGFLVNEKDIELMANKMLFLLNNPNAAIEMGNHLKQKVLAHYTMEIYITQLQQLIQTVLTK